MLSGSSVYVISAVPRRSVIHRRLASAVSADSRSLLPCRPTSASVVLAVRCGSLLSLLIQMPVSHAGYSLYVVAWSLSPACASDDSAARLSLVACIVWPLLLSSLVSRLISAPGLTSLTLRFLSLSPYVPPSQRYGGLSSHRH